MMFSIMLVVALFLPVLVNAQSNVNVSGVLSTVPILRSIDAP